MLAYLFWHAPRAGAGRAEYERGLCDFHRALSVEPPAGFLGSRAFHVADLPWLETSSGYEDWYLVENGAALDALDAAAVSGSRREPHDAVARDAAHGAGGLYRWLAGDPGGSGGGFGLWLTKPRGLSYAEFVSRVHVGAGSLWQRRMVLGPAPEFCVTGLAEPPNPERLPAAWRARVVTRRRVWPQARA